MSGGKTKEVAVKPLSGLAFAPSRDNVARLAEVVSRVLAPFRTYPIGPDEMKSLLRTYCDTLGEYPLEAVVQAGRNLLAGRVQGYSGNAAPTPPQWAKEARSVHLAILPPRAPENPAADLPRSIEGRSIVAAGMDALARRLSERHLPLPAVLADPMADLDAAAKSPVRVTNATRLLETLNKGN